MININKELNLDNEFDKKLQNSKYGLLITLIHDLKMPLRSQNIALNLLILEKCGKLTKAQKNVLNKLLTSNNNTKTMLENLFDKLIDDLYQ